MIIFKLWLAVKALSQRRRTPQPYPPQPAQPVLRVSLIRAASTSLP